MWHKKQSSGFGGKTKRDVDLEKLKEKISSLAAFLATLEKKILSPKFIRDAGLYAMQDAKTEHRKTSNELGKAKRKIAKMEEEEVLK